MKQLTCISVWGLLLFSLSVKAESEKVPHNFSTLNSKKQIEFFSANKVAKTDLLTYKCTGTSAEFGSDGLSIVIKLPSKNSFVTTTRVDELKRIMICTNDSKTPSNFEIYLSKDSVDFGSALSEGITYSSGSIDAAFPRGNYYVRIVNTVTTNTTAMTQIDYYLDHCNCFEYVP